MIDYLPPALALLGTAVAAYTDFKTGYIYDWITYPLIAIGIALRLWSQDWLGLGLGIAVFAALYVFYWTGKLGGGDVKLFTGIALVLPFYQDKVFLLNVLFFAALSAMLFYAVYYLYRLWNEHIPLDIDEKQRNTALLLAAFGIAFSALLAYNNTVSVWVGLCLLLTFLLASAYVACEKTIKKHYFLSEIGIDSLEEDEIVATEFMDVDTLAKSGLNLKKIIGENEKQKLKSLGLATIPVYRDAPRFGPFIFVGTALALLAPQFFAIVFLSV